MSNVAQSSTHRVALIGCGRIAVKHVKAILRKKSGLSLCAVVDTNPDAFNKLLDGAGIKGKRAQRLLQNTPLYRDYAEMLDREKPDITAVTVPSGLHYPICTAAVNAGSHVLLEKPMSMRASEAKSLYELSKKTGKKIAMGHIYRYFPIVGNLQRDVANGRFGKISHGSVIVRWGHDQAYYDSASWRGTWKSDGGALMNQSVHAIDLLCWLMNGDAISATAMLARRFHEMEAEDIACGSLTLDNGALCQVEGTTNSPSDDHEASFYLLGSEGSFRIGLRKGLPFFDIRIRGKKKNREYFMKELKEKGIRALLRLTNPHAGIYEDLREAIEENRQPIADAKSGWTSVETVLALYSSAKTGERTELPLTSDVGSEEMSGFFPLQ